MGGYVRGSWRARVVACAVVACAVGVAGVGLWAGPALAVQCPSLATQCRDWQEVPGRGWMTDVVCPTYKPTGVTESVRNLTSNKLVLAAKNIRCWDWSGTRNPSLITSRVMDPGETLTYRLAATRGFGTRSRQFRIGVFLPSADGMQEMGFVKLDDSMVAGEGVRVDATNTGLPITGMECSVSYLGKDPKRARSGASFVPEEEDGPMTTVYSDGAKLWAARCIRA